MDIAAAAAAADGDDDDDGEGNVSDIEEVPELLFLHTWCSV